MHAMYLCQGLIQGVDWVVSHPPWVCSVHIANSLFEHSNLLEQTILVNKVYDEMQIDHSDRVNRE